MVETVLKILQSKHPGYWATDSASIDSYSYHPPKMVQMDLTMDIVIEVVWRIYGGMGPGDILQLLYLY